ncbi:MAG: hypothetical protein ACRCW2_00050 [Cellulosilyticaceae bacterium]
MKKWVCLIGMTLMLVGCGSLDKDLMVECKVEEDKERNQVYTRDEEEITKLKTFSDQLADAYPENHGKDESGHYLYLGRDTVKRMGMPLSESEYGRQLEEIYPGILSFIQRVENETQDKRPRSIVIDNHLIRMVPTQLFDTNMMYGMADYLFIENNSVRLEDAYMKHLSEAASKEQFIVHEPYMTGPRQLLRFATPNFGSYSYVGEYTDDTYNDGISYYEAGGVAYQLYIADDQLQKIRVAAERLGDETLNETYFDPLLTWCQEELGMNGEALAEVQKLVELIRTGEVKKASGTLAGGDYMYKTAYQSTDYGYNMGQKVESQLIEMVIEMK